MNSKPFAKSLLLGVSLLLASSAFAGDKASVNLFEDVKVNGKTLAPGKYKVEWDGTGSNVQVSIRQGKETIATLPGRIEPTETAPANTGYGTKQQDDGSKSLTSVFFAGKKYTIDLNQQAAAAPATGASSGNQ
ncbi:MAG TPA: hypothetical protein VIW23_16350 [Candidatus Acidoferrum sp.]|jgi:hypothetical protein